MTQLLGIFMIANGSSSRVADVHHLPATGADARLRTVTKVLKSVLIGVGFVVGAALLLAINSARFAGVFRSLDPKFAGRCVAVPLGGSSEDIQIDRERGIAYLSILDRTTLARGEARNGTLMLIDLNVPEPAARAAMSYDPEGFRPHGMSLLKNGSEPARLLAISHRADGSEVVEIAERSSDGAFVPAATIRDAAFVHPNAIAAVGPRQFYLANSSGAAGKFDRAMEMLFRRGLATLVYYDGARARVVASGLKSPSGLAVSADGSRLYVAETLAKVLRIYRRDSATGALTLDETVPLASAPDNLNLDADGVVWIAAHPKLFAFAAHAKDPARLAPTQVFRFDPRLPKPAAGVSDTRVSQIYLNAGDEISAGTVAARWHDEFLIGALLQPKVLICKPQP
jgi:arylesterase / paraoxonase